jgi:hypothetical protein
LDDWKLTDDIRQLTTSRRLPTPGMGNQPASMATLSSIISTPVVASPIDNRLADSASTATTLPKSAHPSRASFFAWLFLSFGLMAFLCGIVLLVWSVVGLRGELWDLGMPITVVGQAGLLLGLILQLERIWQGNRYTAHKLDHVDKQLDDLRQTASILGMPHGSASQAFYSHLTQGASPHILLADLKGQLDLLAVKMSDRR